MTDPTPQTTPTRDEAVLYARYEPEWGRMMLCNRDQFGAVEYRLASAPAPANGGVDAVAGGVDLVAAINHAESELSQHIEKYHDYEDDTPERASLRDIQHHLMGSLIADDGEFLSPAATSGLAMPSREWMRDKIAADPDVEDCGGQPWAVRR